MRTNYDIFKSAKNIKERNLSFEAVTSLDWDTAWAKIDDRFDYGETRYRAYVCDFDGRLFNVVFTVETEAMRVISLRKANAKEVKRYEKRP